MSRSLPSPHREALAYLREIGFSDLYLGDGGGSEEVAEATSVPAAEERAGALARLAEAASTCQLCGLAEGRQKVVFGSGDADADLMFIGEGPGAAEDRQGLPFVGPAGDLLTKIIGAIEMDRSMKRTHPMVSDVGTLGPTPVMSPGTVSRAIMPG